VRCESCYVQRVKRWFWVAIGAGLGSLAPSVRVAAQSEPEIHTASRVRPGDPFAYDLRMAIVPVAFQAGVSQSWFGSAARIEYGVTPWIDVGLEGRGAWWNTNGSQHGYLARLNLSFHVSQSVEQTALAGTVFAEDTPALSPVGIGTDRELQGTPVSDKLKTGDPTPLDRDVTLVAAMRSVHSLRVGLDVAAVTERALPDAGAKADNRMLMLHLGYGFGTHWNLPASVTGKREIGYRRFFCDALLTVPQLTRTRTEQNLQTDVDFFAVGARIGMQGALDALLSAAPGLGLSYDLELGAYPGRGGLEGYLFVGLGLAIDVATG